MSDRVEPRVTVVGGSSGADIAARSATPICDQKRRASVDWPALVGFAPWLWANPALDGEDRKQFSWERLRAPKDTAQPFTPNQYALVLRWDLIETMHELIWRRAQVESLRDEVTRLREQLSKPSEQRMAEFKEWFQRKVEVEGNDPISVGVGLLPADHSAPDHIRGEATPCRTSTPEDLTSCSTSPNPGEER